LPKTELLSFKVSLSHIPKSQPQPHTKKECSTIKNTKKSQTQHNNVGSPNKKNSQHKHNNKLNQKSQYMTERQHNQQTNKITNSAKQ
jgi:hypothetical protein